MSERELEYRLTISYAIFGALMRRMKVKSRDMHILQPADILHQGR